MSLRWHAKLEMTGSWFIYEGFGINDRPRTVCIVNRTKIVREKLSGDPGAEIVRSVEIPTADTDAHIIAAAPELLAAARQAEELVRHGGVVPIAGETWKALTAAIAKAEGKS